MGDFGAAVSLRGYDVKTAADRFLVYSSAFRTLKIFSVTAVTGTFPPGTFADFTADASTNTLTSAGHGLNNGDQVNFTTDDTLPGGLTTIDYDYPWAGEVYYVVNKTTNTFQVSLTPGGSVVDITSAGSGTHTWYYDTVKITYTHSLGYFAPFIVMYNGSTGLGVTSSYLMADGSFFPLQIRQYANYLEIYITPSFDNGATTSGQTVYFTIYQFIDTFDSYSASTISSGTTSGASSDDYGFRISKAGFDVKTCADIDCILSSSFFTSVVHKKGTDTTETVSHGLGYIPAFLSYLQPNGRSFLALANSANVPLVSADTSNLYDSIITAGDVIYYVILKSRQI